MQLSLPQHVMLGEEKDEESENEPEHLVHVDAEKKLLQQRSIFWVAR